MMRCTCTASNAIRLISSSATHASRTAPPQAPRLHVLDRWRRHRIMLGTRTIIMPWRYEQFLTHAGRHLLVEPPQSKSCAIVPSASTPPAMSRQRPLIGFRNCHPDALGAICHLHSWPPVPPAPLSVVAMTCVPFAVPFINVANTSPPEYSPPFFHVHRWPAAPELPHI